MLSVCIEAAKSMITDGKQEFKLDFVGGWSKACLNKTQVFYFSLLLVIVLILVIA